jgi:hypothetical protein
MAKLKGLKATKRKSAELEDGDSAAVERLAAFGQFPCMLVSGACAPPCPGTERRVWARL